MKPRPLIRRFDALVNLCRNRWLWSEYAREVRDSIKRGRK